MSESSANSDLKLPTRIIPLKVSFEDLEYTREGRIDRKILEQAHSVGQARVRFWNMLVGMIGRTDYKIPQDRKVQVLDIGCGRAEADLVLSSFFGGGVFGVVSKNAKVIGIDKNPEEIEKAIRNYQNPDFTGKITTYNLPPEFEFLVGDATNLNSYPRIPKKVDVVVLRHQQISDNAEIWKRIFGQALERVSSEGIILLTSYSDIEHQMAKEALKDLNCEIVLDQLNPYAESAGHKEVSTDRRILVLRKKLQ